MAKQLVKKTITFIDFNGEKRTEDYYFGLSKAEMLEMTSSVNGGYDEYLKRVMQTQDTATLMKLFKELILKAYGIKSLDGRRFEKSDEISKAFYESPAYDELITEFFMSDNPKAASDFFAAVMPDVPPEAVEKAKVEAAKAGITVE